MAKHWSQHVTATSNALDLDAGVFSWSDPKRIARSLKRSAESSTRRKASPAQSAMSMLNFYINRAGHNLPAGQKRILEKAKDELRALFARSREGTTTRKRSTRTKSSGATSRTSGRPRTKSRLTKS